MPYCTVLAIRETINIFLRKPLGIGNHQIKIDAAKVNLKPIKRKGGKYSIAGLAITKPKPKKIDVHVTHFMTDVEIQKLAEEIVNV